MVDSRLCTVRFRTQSYGSHRFASIFYLLISGVTPPFAHLWLILCWCREIKATESIDIFQPTSLFYQENTLILIKVNLKLASVVFNLFCPFQKTNRPLFKIFPLLLFTITLWLGLLSREYLHQ